MNIDLLIKMANEISSFFATEEPDPQQGARAVAAHLRRYWEPRMRRQMITYYEERQGAGLTDLAKSGVALLVAESKAAQAAAAPPAAQTP